ncbi:MAG: TonB-dependent receptor, partial [Deltaproteobacteria bacterium]
MMRTRLAAIVVCAATALVVASPADAQMFTVTFLHTPPSEVVEGKDVEITGNIIGADQVSIAALMYRRPGGEFTVTELALVSGDRYRGVIPGKAVVPPAIEYYCYAVDFEGNRHVIFASEKKPQRVKVVSLEELARRAKVELPDEVKESRKKRHAKKKPKAEKRKRPAKKESTKVTAEICGGAALERCPLAVSVVDGDQILAGGYSTLAEVLDRMAGLSVSRTVSGGYRVSMRGVQGGADVLVLVDGQPLNHGYDGEVLFEFPAEAIERIEVVREPVTGLVGHGTVAGAVLVRTRRTGKPVASAAWGRFNHTRVHGSGGWEKGGVELGGQLQFVFDQGSNREVERDVLSGIGSDDPLSDVSNTPAPVDDFRMQLHAQLHGKLKDLGGGTLGWLGRYLWQRRGALIGKFDSLDSGSRLQQQLVQMGLDYRLPVVEKLNLYSRLDFDARFDSDRFQVIAGGEGHAYYPAQDPSQDPPVTVLLEDGLSESRSADVYRLSGAIGIDWLLPGGSDFGAEVASTYLRLGGIEYERSTGEVTCPQGGLLVQGYLLQCGTTTQPAAQRVTVDVLVKDYWKDMLVEGLDLLAAFRLQWASDYGIALGPQMAVGYNPWRWLGFRTSYSMSFRGPTMLELHQDAGFDPIRAVAGNPDLGPTTLHNWSAGLTSRLGTEGVSVSGRAAFFMSFVDGFISPVDPGGGTPRFRNDESVRLMGLELEAEATFGRRSRLLVNGSWFRARVEPAGGMQASYLTDVPQLRLNLVMDLE